MRDDDDDDYGSKIRVFYINQHIKYKYNGGQCTFAKISTPCVKTIAATAKPDFMVGYWVCKSAYRRGTNSPYKIIKSSTTQLLIANKTPIYLIFDQILYSYIHFERKYSQLIYD